MFWRSINYIKLIAAIIWLTGAVILYLKGFSLLNDAIEIEPDKHWTWIALISGLVIGGLKARYLFNRLCIKNLKRIDAIRQPKPWHCYRPQFFIFLLLMVSLGAYLSRIAQGDYSMLISVAIVDLSLATALLLSSSCFRGQLQQKNTPD